MSKKNRVSRKQNKQQSQATEIARQVGAAVGTALGAKYGAPTMGAKLGSALAGTVVSRMSRVIGRGDYELSDAPKHNSLFKKSPSPNFVFGDDRKIRVRHREFIKNFFTDGTAFSYDVLRMQPGLAEAFPYLWTLSQAFQEYRFHGLVYEFVSNVSPYSTSPNMGAIVLSANYNQGEDPYSNKIAAENSGFAISARPDRNIVLGVECDAFTSPLNKWFIRNGATSNVTTAVEDYGFVQFSAADLPVATYPAGSTVGEIWVTYDVELSMPRMPRLIEGYFMSNRTGCASATPLGTAYTAATPSPTIYGTLYNISIDSANQKILFTDVPVGTVVTCIWLYASSSSTGWTAPTIALTDCSSYNIWGANNIGYVTTPQSGINCSVMELKQTFIVTGNRPSLTFGVAGVLPTPLSYCNIQCTAYGQGLGFAPGA